METQSWGEWVQRAIGVAITGADRSEFMSEYGLCIEIDVTAQNQNQSPFNEFDNARAL